MIMLNICVLHIVRVLLCIVPVGCLMSKVATNRLSTTDARVLKFLVMHMLIVHV